MRHRLGRTKQETLHSLAILLYRGRKGIQDKLKNKNNCLNKKKRENLVRNSYLCDPACIHKVFISNIGEVMLITYLLFVLF